MSAPNDTPAPGGVPESGRVLQPYLWSTIELWHAHETEISSWETAAELLPPQPSDWADRVARLQLINTYQWHQEDLSRDHCAGDTVLAAVKRAIDASNERRIQAVENLDRLIHTRLAAAGKLRQDAPLCSESPGSIVDRLTVLALKVFHAKEALATARRRVDEKDLDLTGMYDRLRSLSEQMVDLTGCLDRMLAEIREGRATFKLYPQVKIYRDVSPG